MKTTRLKMVILFCVIVVGSMMGEVMNTSSQPYRYGGKELVTLENLNLSDFGARWLDSPSGKFTTMDPLCEQFTQYSPYIYCAGNPIKYIDPSGMNWISAIYENHTFYFYDERVKSAEDVKKYYSEDATGISYIGELALVVSPGLTIELLSDGSYMVNAEFQNTEYDNDEIIIGSTLYTDINTINNNFYGSYMGNSNPKCIDGGYSYASPPINKTDYATFLHDREYDKHGAVGASDALLNYKTIVADLKLADRLKSNFEYPSLKGTAWKIGALMLFSNVYLLKLNPIFMLYYWLK